MKSNSKQKINWGFWICLLFMFAVTLAMTKVELGKEYNDFRTHSRWAVGEQLEAQFDKFWFYPVWHFCVKFMNWMFPLGREWSASIVTACFIGVLGALLYLFLEKEMGKRWSMWKCVALTFSLLFLTAIYMPWYNFEVYLGQSSPTIWHNPTNMAVKPFALIIFLYFLHLYEDRMNVKTKQLLTISVLLLLSCFIKPSFVQGFLPALVVFLVLELIPTRGESFGFSLKIALSCIPSGIYFIVQYLSMFGSPEVRKISIQPFAVMRIDAPSPLFSIFLGIAFPLFVLSLLGVKKVFADKPLWLSVLFYLTSLLEFVLFIEEPEARAGNFEWALQLAMFLLFVMTAVRFYQTKWSCKWANIVGNGLFFYHVISGIWYYIWIFVFSHWPC